jgi:hypothetical protein
LVGRKWVDIENKTVFTKYGPISVLMKGQEHNMFYQQFNFMARPKLSIVRTFMYVQAWNILASQSSPRLVNHEILVGIPQWKNTRQGRNKARISKWMLEKLNKTVK